jgi:hypothetical protein
MKYAFVILIFFSAAVCNLAAAEIPATAGTVNSKGFTRIDFCEADGLLYAFNGKDIYYYSSASDSFNVVFANAGSATSSTWDPADFAFLSDSNNIFLPTGESQKVVYADMQSGIAVEKTGLNRNYYSTASRYRNSQLFSNGVGTVNNTIFMLDINGDGSETQVAAVSTKNSGAIAFDFADNLYVADFKPVFDGRGLGYVDIYRISRGQLDSFVENNSFTVSAKLIVNNALLAGSDSIVVDADYNIYMGSYVGIAKIVPTSDPNNFAVTAIDGNIYANPHAFPVPNFKFSGITADIKNGKIYYGKSELDQNTYVYGPYTLYSFNVAAAENWSADLDGDGIVDFNDLYLMQEGYLYSGTHLKGDIDESGFVDFHDFAIFANQWQNKAAWYKRD